MSSLSVGDDVTLVAKSSVKLSGSFASEKGKLYKGVVTSLRDWQVGCPVVKLTCGQIVDIGYYFELA